MEKLYHLLTTSIQIVSTWLCCVLNITLIAIIIIIILTYGIYLQYVILNNRLPNEYKGKEKGEKRII